MSLKIDFYTSDIEVIDNPQAAQETEELKTLYRIIHRTPGISQNKIADASGMKRARVSELLARNIDVLWTVQQKGQSYCYYPPTTVSQ
jgi:hypothetical protein